MQTPAKRYGPAATAVSRAREAARVLGLMANTSWSSGSCFLVPTTDHEIGPRRLTVIPT